MNVATIILQQLGGNKFIAMTGAKDIFADGNALQFKLPKTPGFVTQGINFVKIRLMPTDTYQMEFSKITMKDYVPTIKQIKQYDDVYCDQLQVLFTETTGLATHL
jgi:hypothetical protein